MKVLSRVKTVSFSLVGGNAAAITENGDLYCWGDNTHGQVGNGTMADQNSPVKVLSKVKTVSLDGDNAAAVTEDGDLYCWGNNRYGQVGNGMEFGCQSSPQKIIATSGDEGLDEPEAPDSLVTALTMDPSMTGEVDTEFDVSGTLAIQRDMASYENIMSQVGTLEYASSDPDVADVIGYSCTPSLDDSYVRLTLTVAAYHVGSATITCTAPNGVEASCSLTIEEPSEEEGGVSGASDFDLSIYRANVIHRTQHIENEHTEDGGLPYYVDMKSPADIIHGEAESSGLATASDAWKLMNDVEEIADDPSGLPDKLLEKADMYQGIVFALFEAASESYLSDAYGLMKDANNLFQTIKDGMELSYDIHVSKSYDMSKLTDVQRQSLEQMSKEYFNSRKLVRYADTCNEMFKGMDYAMKLEDYVGYVSSSLALAQMGEGYKRVLREMCDLCPGGATRI